MAQTTDDILSQIEAAWDFSKPADSETRFVTLLDTHASAAPETRSLILTQIARARGLQRRFTEADAALDQAEALLSEKPSRARIMMLMERGRVRNSSGTKAEARPLFLAAYEMALSQHLDALAVDAAHMLGVASPGDEGLAWTQKAMSAARSSTDPRARKWVASLANNIGWALHDRGDFAAAFACFQEALRERERAGNRAPILVAHWCVARCLRSLGRVGEALDIQRTLEAEHAQSDTPDGFVHEEIGECLLAMSQPEAARPHFARAHELLSADPWLAESDPKRLARLAELGWTSPSTR
jgi:tetratricopeptide (TPR) repeat protein